MWKASLTGDKSTAFIGVYANLGVKLWEHRGWEKNKRARKPFTVHCMRIVVRRDYLSHAKIAKLEDLVIIVVTDLGES